MNKKTTEKEVQTQKERAARFREDGSFITITKKAEGGVK